MNLHEDITSAIRKEMDQLGGAIPLSPTTLALAVQRKFMEDEIEPHLQYASLEHIKQMARKALARRFEPEGDENKALQGDMFSGLLQAAYPVPVEAGTDPIYKPLSDLTDAEADWNIESLRKRGAALIQHGDALQAWRDRRNEQRAA